MRDAIIQMFDWRFDHVARALPELRALGYEAVHVSPPQHSNEAEWRWWGRYQPTGYGIGGPLGSAEAFAAMAAIARAQGMRVVADVVLRNPCGPPDMLCGVTLDERAAAFQAGLDYLRRLRHLGADGFRFDAAGAIPPEFLRWALPRLNGAAAFGELVSDRIGDLAPYFGVPEFRMLDFPLLSTLREACAPGGDLRLLREPAGAGRALHPGRSVGFARNHDIERGQADDHGIDDGLYRARFGVGWREDARTLDRASVDLAHAYLFGREGGAPYVLAAMRTLPEAARIDRHDDPIVVAGLAFRAGCGGCPEIWRIVRPEAIAWQRGRRRLAILNGHFSAFHVAGVVTSLLEGAYRDIATGATLLVARDGRVTAGSVPARSAGLYVPA